MIERCTKRRMLLSIVLLIGLSIAIVLLEHHLTQNTHFNTFHVNNQSTQESEKQCWLVENFELIEECNLCTDADKSNHPAACSSTGYKEKLRCAKSGEVLRSCERVLWLEEKRFWTLELVSLVFGLVSCTFVMWRQRILEHKHYVRLQQQIGIIM